MNLPHANKPCKDCPFRKDSMKGWLGKDRIIEILNEGSFVCHKNTKLQCAGHMLIKGNRNDFVKFAQRLGLSLKLSKKELIFDNIEDCIKHHTYDTKES